MRSRSLVPPAPSGILATSTSFLIASRSSSLIRRTLAPSIGSPDPALLTLPLNFIAPRLPSGSRPAPRLSAALSLLQLQLTHSASTAHARRPDVYRICTSEDGAECSAGLSASVATTQAHRCKYR